MASLRRLHVYVEENKKGYVHFFSRYFFPHRSLIARQGTLTAFAVSCLLICRQINPLRFVFSFDNCNPAQRNEREILFRTVATLVWANFGYCFVFRGNRLSFISAGKSISIKLHLLRNFLSKFYNLWHANVFRVRNIFLYTKFFC